MKRCFCAVLGALGLASAPLLAGCASQAPPPAVAEAERSLDGASPAAKLERAGLVADAKELLSLAKEVAARGETEKATLYARQSIQKLRMAGAFAEREQVEAFLAALEKSKRAEPGAPKQVPVTQPPTSEGHVRESTVVVLAPGRDNPPAPSRPEPAPAPASPQTVAPPPSAQDGSLKALSERKLVELQFKRSEALGQGKDHACPTTFREYESILELSQRRFDARDYERSYEFSLRAEERFRACDARAATAPPTKANDRPSDEAAGKKAAASIQKAQVELARVDASAEGDPGAAEGRVLLANAVTWFDKRSFSEADDLALRAYAVLARVRPRAATAAPATPKPGAGDPGAEPCADAKRLTEESKESEKVIAGQKLSSADEKARTDAKTDLAEGEKRVARKACTEAMPLLTRARDTFARLAHPQEKPALGQKPWEGALVAIQEAEKSKALAKGRITNDADRTTFTRGETALARATSGYDKNDLPEAEKAAKEARLFFDGIKEKEGPLAKVEPKQEPKQEPKAEQKQEPKVAADAGTAAERRVAAYPTETGVDQAWRGAYPKVYRALAIRDEARSVSPHERKKLADADARVEAARAAWAGKRYAEAGSHADAAMLVLEPLTRAEPDGGSEAELDAARKGADMALRASGERATICEKERCIERDVKKLAAAKELHESAKRAYDAKRFKAATELADHAKAGFDEVLAIALPGATDAEKDKALRPEAEDALRDATVKEKLCETSGCATHAAESVVRARETLLSAKVACTDKRYGICRDRAREAETTYQLAMDAAPSFAVPADIKGISKSGDVLLVSPPLVYTNGTTALDSKSQPSVAALARTLLENKKTLKRVNLVGYTDNRGIAAQNKKLSEGRAQTLRQALIGKGVPADLLVAEGRGADAPIADNTTAEGRERNRRVEIHLELLDGVK